MMLRESDEREEFAKPPAQLGAHRLLIDQAAPKARDEST
jgi:hypothetical protein